MFKDWGKGNEPPDWVTKEECQEMIDNAIRKHNRNWYYQYVCWILYLRTLL